MLPALTPYLKSPQKPCELGGIFLAFQMRKLTFRHLCKGTELVISRVRIQTQRHGAEAKQHTCQKTFVGRPGGTWENRGFGVLQT